MEINNSPKYLSCVALHTHVAADEIGAGGGDREDGHVRELSLENAQLAVLRPEIVPPLHETAKEETRGEEWRGGGRR